MTVHCYLRSHEFMTFCPFLIVNCHSVVVRALVGCVWNPTVPAINDHSVQKVVKGLHCTRMVKVKIESLFSKCTIGIKWREINIREAVKRRNHLEELVKNIFNSK